MNSGKKRKCSVPGCTDVLSKRHRFPNPKTNIELFNVWLKNVANEKLFSLSFEKIYQDFYICHVHFSPNEIVLGTRRGLKATSVPTLFLPKMPKSEPQIMENPKDEEDQEDQLIVSMSINPLSLCRVCFNIDVLNSFKSLDSNFQNCETEINSQRIVDILEIVTHTKINLDDVTLPSKICQACNKDLEVCHAFLTKYVSNQNKLLFVIKEPPSPPPIIKTPPESPTFFDPNPTNNKNLPSIKLKPIIHLKPSVDVAIASDEVTVASDDAAVASNDVTDGERVPYAICEQCGHVSYTLASHKVHRRMHNGRQHTCGVCNKSYMTAANMKYHMKVKHQGRKIEARPYLCSVCGKMCNSFMALRYHLQVHNDTKNFACAHCGRKFIMRDAKDRHERRHTNVRPYECDQCDWRFVGASDLIRHKASHRTDKPFKCELCGMEFKSTWKRKKHMGTHPGPFQCNFCRKRSFLESGFLEAHIRRAHQKHSVVETENSEEEEVNVVEEYLTQAEESA